MFHILWQNIACNDGFVFCNVLYFFGAGASLHLKSNFKKLFGVLFWIRVCLLKMVCKKKKEEVAENLILFLYNSGELNPFKIIIIGQKIFFIFLKNYIYQRVTPIGTSFWLNLEKLRRIFFLMEFLDTKNSSELRTGKQEGIPKGVSA